jgi:hypothetical protein
MLGLIADPAGHADEIDTAIDRLRVDVLHAVSDTAASRAAAERNPHLRWPLIGDGILSADQPDEPGLVDLSRGLALRAEEQVGESPVVPIWEEADGYALVYAATFGDFAHQSLGPKQRAEFVRVTGADEVLAEDVAAAFDHHEVPLDASRSGLMWLPPRVAIHDIPGVFVRSATSLVDVRAYWNTRAIGTEVVFWDTRDADGGPFRAVIESRIRVAAQEQHAEPRNFRTFPCYVSVRARRHRAQLPTALRSLIEAAGLMPTTTPIAGDVGIAAWIYRGIRSLPAVPDERVVAHTEERGEDQSRITIELPRTRLLPYRGWTRQELGVQIETYVDSGYRGTLKLPYLPDLNGWYRWHISGAVDHFRVQDDAFTLITSMLGPTLDIAPMRRRLLLEKLFERAGIATTRSLPGEAAWHLLLQFGGYSGLRVLRIPGVRKLLSSTRARSGITRRAARDLISDRGQIDEAEATWIGGQRLDAARRLGVPLAAADLSSRGRDRVPVVSALEFLPPPRCRGRSAVSEVWSRVRARSCHRRRSCSLPHVRPSRAAH